MNASTVEYDLPTKISHGGTNGKECGTMSQAMLRSIKNARNEPKFGMKNHCILLSAIRYGKKSGLTLFICQRLRKGTNTQSSHGTIYPAGRKDVQLRKGTLGTLLSLSMRTLYAGMAAH